MYDYPLGASTSLISAVQQFARLDYSVDVFISEAGFNACPVSFKDKEVTVRVIKPLDSFLSLLLRRLWIYGYIKKKFVKVTFEEISGFIDFNIKFLYFSLMDSQRYESLRSDSPETFNKKISRLCALLLHPLWKFQKILTEMTIDEYDLIIGVEPKGLVIAQLLAHSKRSSPKVVYFNMELLLEKECIKKQRKILKMLERACNQRSFLTVIQDKHRAGHLIADNSLDPKKVMCIPVCSFGPAVQNKSDYLQNLFNIEKNKKIILYAGNIIEWSMCLELAEAAQTWSEKYVLVLHTWRPDAKDDQYVRKIIPLTKSNKVYLSLNPLDYSDLSKLVSSADFGVIFYKNLGENFFETGNSSNKLAQYLQFGLPVITIDFPSFLKVIKKYDCGKSTNTPMDIQNLAETIDIKYNYYRTNAFRCYREMFDISKYFTILEEKINHE